MFVKMREFLRITLVFLCAFLLTVREGRGEDVTSLEEDSVPRTDGGERKDGKAGLLPGTYVLSINKSRRTMLEPFGYIT